MAQYNTLREYCSPYSIYIPIYSSKYSTTLLFALVGSRDGWVPIRPRLTDYEKQDEYFNCLYRSLGFWIDNRLSFKERCRTKRKDPP